VTLNDLERRNGPYFALFSRNWEVEIAAIRQAIYHFLLVVCCNIVSILHRFRDITTFTAYLTACATFRNHSVLIRQLKLHIACAFRIICKHIVDNSSIFLISVKAEISRGRRFDTHHPMLQFLGHLVPWPSIDIHGKFYGDRPRGTPPSEG